MNLLGRANARAQRLEQRRLRAARIENKQRKQVARAKPGSWLGHYLGVKVERPGLWGVLEVYLLLEALSNVPQLLTEEGLSSAELLAHKTLLPLMRPFINPASSREVNRARIVATALSRALPFSWMGWRLVWRETTRGRRWRMVKTDSITGGKPK